MRYKYASSVADVMVARGETTVTLIDSTGTPTARVGKVLAVPSVGLPLTVWDQEIAGTRITDLQDDTDAGITDVTPGTDGRVAFYAPDGVATTLWLDDGSGGARWPVNPSELGTILDTLADPTLYVRVGDDAADLGSGAAAASRVLTADGAGGASWEVGGVGGATDHGALTGLGDDDHVQYHNNTRGDARYYTKAQVDYGTHVIIHDAGAWHYRGSTVTTRPTNIPAYPAAHILFKSATSSTITTFTDLPFTPSRGDQWEPYAPPVVP